MRTIKFRAWTNRCWVNDGMVYDYEKTVYVEDFGFDSEEMPIMQYTGLKDKHGKDIFEGDIVEAWSQGVKGTFEVLWRQEGLPCFILYPAYQKGEMWKLHGSKHENGIYYDKGVEVIGNKFEHPELLEQPNAN